MVVGKVFYDLKGAKPQLIFITLALMMLRSWVMRPALCHRAPSQAKWNFNKAKTFLDTFLIDLVNLGRGWLNELPETLRSSIRSVLLVKSLTQ